MISQLLASERTKPLVFGHRGASEEYPENTILSFEMAIKQGAIGVETDLQYTKDHQIVCFHDRYLGRLTKEHGSINNSTLKYLSNIRIKHNKSTAQPIPTLLDLLEWLPKENFVLLELKDRRFSNAENMDAFINILAKHNIINKTILASFNKTNLEQAKKILPSMMTCHITLCNIFPNAKADIFSPFYPILLLNPSYTDESHKKKKFVSVWDPHPENRMEYYLTKHVDIITSDNPKKVLDLLSKIAL